MKPLSEKQKEKIRTEFYRQWKTCENEITLSRNSSTVINSSQHLFFVLHTIIKNTFSEKEINYQTHRDYQQLLNQLQLNCLTCGQPLKPTNTVGKYLGNDAFWRSAGYILDKNNSISMPNWTLTDIVQLQIQTESNSSRRGTIACIDDSRQIIKVMKKIITKIGYDYIGIQEPLEALPALISSKPDLIFLDIEMPLLNGYEICGKIRKISSLKNTPVVILTSKDGLIDRARAKFSGTTKFLAKPLQINKIIEAIETLMLETSKVPNATMS